MKERTNGTMPSRTDARTLYNEIRRDLYGDRTPSILQLGQSAADRAFIDLGNALNMEESRTGQATAYRVLW